jgi:purine-binding chemotaxis protein CheW
MGVELKVVVFSIGNEEYGVEVDKVRTIEKMLPFTRVPKTPVFVKGVINLRGIIVPIIDLRSRFGLEETAYTSNTRLIIVAAGDIEVGLIVDSANDVINVDSERIEQPPEVVGGIRAKYLQGIVKMEQSRLLVLLNLQEVLNKSELIQLQEMER